MGLTVSGLCEYYCCIELIYSDLYFLRILVAEWWIYVNFSLQLYLQEYVPGMKKSLYLCRVEKWG